MFRIGQKVVCVVHSFYVKKGTEHTRDPKKDEVVQVTKITYKESTDTYLLSLRGFDQKIGYDHKGFAPLDESREALEEMIEELNEEFQTQLN